MLLAGNKRFLLLVINLIYNLPKPFSLLRTLKPQPTLWAIIKIFRSLIATITTTLKDTAITDENVYILQMLYLLLDLDSYLDYDYEEARQCFKNMLQAEKCKL